MKKWWFQKNHFICFELDASGTIPKGKLLKVYIYRYFHFPFFSIFLYNRLPQCTVSSASNLKLPNWFFTIHFLLNFLLLHLFSFKGLNCYLLILLLTYCFLLKNRRDNNIIIEEYIKIINKSKGKKKKVKDL